MLGIGSIGIACMIAFSRQQSTVSNEGCIRYQISTQPRYISVYLSKHVLLDEISCDVT